MFVSKFFSPSITSTYSISPNLSFLAGPWSVHAAKSKSSGEAVSVFVYDKKRLESYLNKSGMARGSSVEVIDRLKREVACLAKLRHPSILKLIEPLEESRGTLRFVTEPVTATLKSLIDVNSSSVGASTLDSGDFDEIVIQKGLLQICEGLEFLHDSAQMVHLDVQPSSIMVNTQGDWKLAGLGFVEPPHDTTYFLPRFDSRLPQFVQINLDYAAPELVLDHRLDYANDVFSLGCLILTLYLMKSPLSTNNNSSVYREEFGSIARSLRDPRIPKYLADVIPQLVSRNPIERPALRTFKTSQFFDNVLIRTINFLDDLPAKLPSEKQTFMSGLGRILDQFPKSVLQRKILPTLLGELDKDEVLVAPTLVNVLRIGRDMSQLGFVEQISPAIRKVASISSAQVVVLQNMDVMNSRLNGNQFKEDILPIVLNAIQSTSPEIQETALGQIPNIIEKMDFITLKNEVFLAVSEVFAKTTSLSVKLTALQAFQQLVAGGLDKFTITEKLLPVLNIMKTREPKVLVAALEVYKEIVPIVDLETLANIVIPHLLTMSMESLLNIGQFQAFMAQIKQILARIEQDHGKKLSQVQINPHSVPARPTSTNDFDALVGADTSRSSRDIKVDDNPRNSRDSNGIISPISPSNPLESLNNPIKPISSSRNPVNPISLNTRTAPLNPLPPPKNSTNFPQSKPSAPLSAPLSWQSLSPSPNGKPSASSNTPAPINWNAPKPANSQSINWTSSTSSTTPMNAMNSSSQTWNSSPSASFGAFQSTPALKPLPAPGSGLASQSKPKGGLDQYESLL